MEFKKLQSDQHLFLEMLPNDWQKELQPFWTNIKDSSELYVIMENEKIIGGGIVFSEAPPDIFYYKDEAQQWFDSGFLYLGFIWISENKRNMNLGSFWLEELKNNNPNQKFWLLIEDEHLHRFYDRNGFILNKTICNQDHPEWLYTFTPVSSDIQ